MLLEDVGTCTFQLLHTSNVGERAISDVETAWTGQSEKSGPRRGTATRTPLDIPPTVPGEDIIAVVISRGETASQHVSTDVLCGWYGRRGLG